MTKSKDYFKYGAPLLNRASIIKQHTIEPESAAQSLEKVRSFLRTPSTRPQFVQSEMNDGLTQTAGASIEVASTILGAPMIRSIGFFVVSDKTPHARGGEAYPDRNLLLVNANQLPGAEVYRNYLRIVGISVHEGTHVLIGQNNTKIPSRLEEGICELTGAIGKEMVEGRAVSYTATIANMRDRAVRSIAVFKSWLDDVALSDPATDSVSRLFKINDHLTEYGESPYILAGLLLGMGKEISLGYNGRYVPNSDFTIPFVREMLYKWSQYREVTQGRVWPADMIASSLVVQKEGDTEYLTIDGKAPTGVFIQQFYTEIVQKAAGICGGWSEIAERIR